MTASFQSKGKLDKELKKHYETRAKEANTLSVTYLSEGVVRSFYRQRSEKILEILAEAALNLKPERILDIGCGAGWYLKKLSKMGNVLGLDFCMDYLLQAKHFCTKGLFINADAQALPFRHDSFNLILCTETLEHVHFPRQLLREIFRVLSKNGVAIITTPMKHSMPEVSNRKKNVHGIHNIEHISLLTYKEFTSALKENFILIKTDATSFIPLNKVTYLLYKQPRVIKIINAICSKTSFLRSFSWCVIAIVMK